jgi:hypothetical protein
MRTCTSITLTKILLGIASAGALLVSPISASAEVVSEAPASEDAASSPSGLLGLLSLNPWPPLHL